MKTHYEILDEIATSEEKETKLYSKATVVMAMIAYNEQSLLLNRDDIKASNKAKLDWLLTSIKETDANEEKAFGDLL